MSDVAGIPLGGGGNKGLVRVAIMAQPAEMAQQVQALAEETQALEVQVLGDAADYFEVYGSAAAPDVLLVGLDVEPQEVLASAKRICALAPTCGVIVFGSAMTLDLLSEAMAAGARRHLTFPFNSVTLLKAVSEVRQEMKPLIESTRMALPAPSTASSAPDAPQWREPKVVAVFSPKGGVGTTTLAVNLACALSTMDRSVVIVDGNISFGNLGVFLNMSPSKSMLQTIGDPNGIQDSSIDEVLLTHSSGIKIMLAPLKPEEGDSIHGDHLRQIIANLRARFDYVVVDTWPSYDERVLAMLEVADQVLVPTGPELPSIKNLAAFLRVARLLEYPKDKLIPILVRANSVSPGHLHDIESFLKQPLIWRIVSDGKRVTQAVNNGEPFVLTDPAAPVSQNIYALANMLDGRTEVASTPANTRPVPFWRRPLFRLGKAG